MLETEWPDAGEKIVEKLARSAIAFKSFDEIESIPRYRHQPTPGQR
jgi:hypothetical protein